MKTHTILGAAVVLALALGVVATLLGGRVSNPTGFEGSSNSKSIYIDSQSHGWPVPWQIDANAAKQAGIATGGVSISSFVFSVALWFWATLAALVLVHEAIRRHWIDDLGGIAIACVISFGIASLITILGTINTSDGVWYSGRGLTIAYETAGWPFEWKTNPALPVWTGIYETISQKNYHEAMRPYKMLGYSPVWLATNWLFVAFPAALALLLGRSVWTTFTGLRPGLRAGLNNQRPETSN